MKIEQDLLEKVYAGIAAEIAKSIRANCTVPPEALEGDADTIVYAVADWVEAPPAWVAAPWAKAVNAILARKEES